MKSGSVNRLHLTLCSLLALLYLLGLSCDEGGPKPGRDGAAVIVERSRDVNQTSDFLRIIFLPSNVTPTQLGRPDALRVFVSASVFFEPPVSLQQTAAFLGIPVGESQTQLDLVALRCIPDVEAELEPSLATWPRVFELAASDLGGEFTCPPDPGSPENELFCLAQDFTDAPSQIVSDSIENALGLGAGIMSDPDLAGVLGQIYGIGPSFSGLGFSVNASAGNALTSAQALERSVVTEYLVRNATLPDAGCFCVRVPPYEGREEDLLDMDFIVNRGGFGECNVVNRLGSED